MKKVLFITTLVFLWVILHAANASALLIRVPLYSGEIFGEESPAFASVEVKLWNKNGALKGWVLDTAESDGDWEVEFPSAVVMPGDRVEVRLNGIPYNLNNLAEINITKISPNKDIVAGRVKPRKSNLVIHLEGVRFRQTGPETVEHDEENVATAPDGTFRKKLGFNLKRLDRVYVGYFAGDFVVYNVMFAPGLQLIFGSQNYGILGGRKGTSYQLRLMDRKGKVKTTLHTNLATFPLDGAGLIEFSKPGGKPVTVKSGDRIKVMGKWGWTDKVEPLKLSVDVASDTFTVKAKPNAVVHLYLRGTEEFQRVDENGELIFNWWTERSLHVNPRDECEIVYQDKQGNVYFKEVQAF